MPLLGKVTRSAYTLWSVSVFRCCGIMWQLPIRPSVLQTRLSLATFSRPPHQRHRFCSPCRHVGSTIAALSSLTQHLDMMRSVRAMVRKRHPLPQSRKLLQLSHCILLHGNKTGNAKAQRRTSSKSPREDPSHNSVFPRATSTTLHLNRSAVQLCPSIHLAPQNDP